MIDNHNTHIKGVTNYEDKRNQKTARSVLLNRRNLSVLSRRKRLCKTAKVQI